MIPTEIDYVDNSAWSDEPVTEVLHALIHDVNNITNTIKGFATLVDMNLHDGTEIDVEFTQKAMDHILERTDELTKLMRLTAMYNEMLENQF